MKGYIQVYTGNGKGKSTAALGLTVRALGAGLSVYIGQFLKSGEYSEIKTLRELAGLCAPGQKLTVEQFGSDGVIRRETREEDRTAAADGWDRCRRAVLSGEYDIVICEEINVAVHMDQLSLEPVLSLMRSKPSAVELILTGRHAPEEFLKIADLVTEMLPLKHYFDSGVPARKGIEL